MKATLKKLTAILLLLMLTAALCTSCAMAETPAPIYSADDLFTKRDLRQTADLSDAVTHTVSDGQDIHITKEGVYVLTGQAANATVYVEADKDDKVQLVLDGVNVINDNVPVIFVKTADKVFVTVQTDSSLSVTGVFNAEGSANGVIFSKTDLTLNGTAALMISSSENGVVGKDDVKITGGAFTITAASKAIVANDSIRIADGNLNLTAGTDGLHAENKGEKEDYIYIGGGAITIQAGDDAIHATSVVQIDGGTILIQAGEGIEGTYVQINGGTISIQGADDGINAANKSGTYTATFEMNGGELTVAAGPGDTDGIDSNGYIFMNGGTVNITGTNAFDYDAEAKYLGGTIIVNGQQLSEIPSAVTRRK